MADLVELCMLLHQSRLHVTQPRKQRMTNLHGCRGGYAPRVPRHRVYERLDSAADADDHLLRRLGLCGSVQHLSKREKRDIISSNIFDERIDTGQRSFLTSAI